MFTLKSFNGYGFTLPDPKRIRKERKAAKKEEEKKFRVIDQDRGKNIHTLFGGESALSAANLTIDEAEQIATEYLNMGDYLIGEKQAKIYADTDWPFRARSRRGGARGRGAQLALAVVQVQRALPLVVPHEQVRVAVAVHVRPRHRPGVLAPRRGGARGRSVSASIRSN